MSPWPLPKIVSQKIHQHILDYLEFSRQGPRLLSEREQKLKVLNEALDALLLQEDARADQKGLKPPVCECGATMRSHGLRKRSLVASVTRVLFKRRYYICPECKAKDYPLDRAWGIERGSLSPAAKEIGVDMATTLTFREARWWLERLGGISISLSTLWRVTQEAGAELLAQRQAEEAACQSREGAGRFLRTMRGEGAPGRWALAVDGLFIRVACEGHEVKVAVLGRLNGEGEWERGTTSYVASQAEAGAFRQQVVRHACQRKVTRKSLWVILSDGAAWIEGLGRRYFPEAIRVRDWWHAVQYLWKAAQALQGEGSKETKALVRTLKGLLWKGQVSAVQRRLERERRKHPIKSEAAQEEYRKAMVYLENQGEHMQYEEYRKVHCPIGSGPAEAGCKTLVGGRMKRSGMNWSEKGGEHMLLLRASYCTRLNAILYPQS